MSDGLIKEGLKAFSAGDLERAGRLWFEARAKDPTHSQLLAYLDHLRSMDEVLYRRLEQAIGASVADGSQVFGDTAALATEPSDQPPGARRVTGHIVLPVPAPPPPAAVQAAAQAVPGMQTPGPDATMISEIPELPPHPSAGHGGTHDGLQDIPAMDLDALSLQDDLSPGVAAAEAAQASTSAGRHRMTGPVVIGRVEAIPNLPTIEIRAAHDDERAPPGEPVPAQVQSPEPIIEQADAAPQNDPAMTAPPDVSGDQAPINDPDSNDGWGEESGVSQEIVPEAAAGMAIVAASVQAAAATEAQELSEQLGTAGATAIPSGGGLAALSSRLEQLMELDDFTGAVDVANAILALDAGHARAQAVKEDGESRLLAMFKSQIGDTKAIPRVLKAPEDVIWLDLDHRSGFVLAQIDGTCTYEDIVELTGMAALESYRVLSRLVQGGIIGP